MPGVHHAVVATSSAALHDAPFVHLNVLTRKKITDYLSIATDSSPLTNAYSVRLVNNKCTP